MFAIILVMIYNAQNDKLSSKKHLPSDSGEALQRFAAPWQDDTYRQRVRDEILGTKPEDRWPCLKGGGRSGY